MPFRFTCPICGTETLVADHYEGATGPCAMCGQMVTVTRPSGRSTRAEQRAEAGTTNYVEPHTVRAMLGILVLVAALGSFAAWMVWTVGWPTWKSWMHQGSHQRCRDKLRQIGLALLNYYDTWGRFPPAVTYDANGKAMHSWRVLILPYLGEQALYQRYDLTQPWNSPSNMQLLNQIPDVFKDDSSNRGHTMVVAITGPGTLFPPTGSGTYNSVAKPASHVVVVAEMARSNILWTEPRDLSITNMRFELNNFSQPSIRAQHSAGPHVLTLDGSSHWLRSDVPEHLVRSLLDGNDRTMFPWNTLEVEGP